MAALTQDYKAQRRARGDSRRLRDFGYGAVCGAVLTALACAWLGARAHTEKAEPATVPHHAAAAPRPADPASAQTFTFPDMLAKTTVPVYSSDRDARHPAPPVHGPAH